MDLDLRVRLGNYNYREESQMEKHASITSLYMK